MSNIETFIFIGHDSFVPGLLVTFERNTGKITIEPPDDWFDQPLGPNVKYFKSKSAPEFQWLPRKIANVLDICEMIKKFLHDRYTNFK